MVDFVPILDKNSPFGARDNIEIYPSESYSQPRTIWVVNTLITAVVTKPPAGACPQSSSRSPRSCHSLLFMGNDLHKCNSVILRPSLEHKSMSSRTMHLQNSSTSVRTPSPTLGLLQTELLQIHSNTMGLCWSRMSFSHQDAPMISSSLTTWVHPWDISGEKREVTPLNCPLTSIHIVTCTCLHAHTYKHRSHGVKQNKPFLSWFPWSFCNDKNHWKIS